MKMSDCKNTISNSDFQPNMALYVLRLLLEDVYVLYFFLPLGILYQRKESFKVSKLPGKNI